MLLSLVMMLECQVASIEKQRPSAEPKQGGSHRASEQGSREASSINDSDADTTLLMDFLNKTLTMDPYQWPDAAELLKHPFWPDLTR